MKQTSRKENIPFRVINIFRMRSVYAACITFFFVALIGMILRNLGIINGPVYAFLFLISGCLAFYFSEKLHDGRYPLENCEKFISKIKIRTSKFSLDDVVEGNCKIRKPIDIDSHSKEFKQYDEKSWYLPTGEEIIGIKINQSYFNEKTNSYQFYTDEKMMAFCSSLFQILPINSSVKFISPNSIDNEIPNFLKEKKIMKGEYFIFLRFTNKISTDNRKEIMKLINGIFIRLNHEEMAAITEKIFFPFNIPSGYNSPNFKSAFSYERGVIKGTWVGVETAVITLTQLPEFIDDSFQKIYTCFSDVSSTIALTVFSTKLDTSISKFVKEKIKIKSGKVSENEDLQKTQENETSCLLQLSILIHGKEELISQKISELESICVSFGQEMRPIFGQDIAFPSDALKSFLPASLPRIPFRKHKVKTISEILFLLPKPKFSKKLKGNTDLNLRTIDNRLFQIKLSPEYPVIYVSPPGSGKSLYLSVAILAHIRKKNLGGVGGCYIEIGMSFKFLCQEGLADAYLTITKEDKFLPLEDHPLKAFFAFDSFGITAATEWICELCGINGDIESAVAAQIRDIVIHCYELNIYSLMDFYLLFFEKFSPKIHDDSKWLDRIQNLKNFVDPNVYGEVFVPKDPKGFEWKKAKFIYFTTSSTKVTQPKKLYGAFFSLAIALCDLLSEKHNSKQKEPLEMQLIVDEVHAARENISQKKIRLLNSQSRKDGLRGEFATQELTDFVIDDEDQEKKYAVITTTRRLFFKENPGELIAYMFRTKEETNELMRKIERISKSNLELLNEGKYAWGYIDEHKNIHQILLDVEQVDLWATTTHAGSIAIRQACLRTGLYDYWETCELLAKYGPKILPKFIPPPDEIEKIVDKVMRIQS